MAWRYTIAELFFDLREDHAMGFIDERRAGVDKIRVGVG